MITILDGKIIDDKNSLVYNKKVKNSQKYNFVFIIENFTSNEKELEGYDEFKEDLAIMEVNLT